QVLDLSLDDGAGGQLDFVRGRGGGGKKKKSEGSHRAASMVTEPGEVDKRGGRPYYPVHPCSSHPLGISAGENREPRLRQAARPLPRTLPFLLPRRAARRQAVRPPVPRRERAAGAGEAGGRPGRREDADRDAQAVPSRARRASGVVRGDRQALEGRGGGGDGAAAVGGVGPAL